MKDWCIKKYLHRFVLLGIFGMAFSLFYFPNHIYAANYSSYTTISNHANVSSDTIISSNMNHVSNTKTTDNFRYLYDKAKLLTDDEASKIKKECKKLSEQYDIHVLILTNKKEDNDPTGYVEDLYDSHETEWNDAVILYINMTSRGVRIDGFGACASIFDSAAIDTMLDQITPYLADEDCYNGMFTFLSNVDTILSQPTSADANTITNQPSSSNTDSVSGKNSSSFFMKGTLICLVISFIIGGMAVGIMAYNSTGRMTANGSTYIDPKHSKVLGQWDRYIRTTTTRVPKPKDNSNNTNGFGGGGGISSGGNEHSGGGRNF